MTRHVIAPVDELPPGTRKFLTIDERPIAIFNIKGEFFGLLNRCPHQGAALCEGPLIGLAQSTDPGEIEYTKLGEIIRCPWHGWEFDIRTGQSYCDPKRFRARAYPVNVEPGSSVVKGPYVAETIKVALAKKHSGEAAFEILSVESVGPKVGAELRRRGFLAVACTTLFMGIYIAFRFELSFGVGAVIALVHDVLIALLALIVSRTIFDLTTLAAMMTVIGFSVHDTIIVSDRVRENLRKMRRSNLAEVINLSINETLSRTILTTGTALLVLLALYFLGGPGLQPFAFTLIVGFLTGTYSSIFIAAPVVLFWSSRSKLAQAD